MKVLLVSHFFPPTHTAGAEQRTLAYARHLTDRGLSVQVLCAGDWDRGEQYWNGFTDEHYQGIAVRRVHLNWALAHDPNRGLYRNPLLAEHLDDWLAEWRVDLVHVVSCYTLSASVVEVAKRCQLPVILTLTDYWSVCPRLSLLRGDGTLCDGRTTSEECLRCLLWDSGLYQRLNIILPDRVTSALAMWASQTPRVSRLRGLRGMALDMDERRAFLAKMLTLADRITAPSHHLATTVAAAGVTKPVCVIRSGHDLRWLTAMPARRRSNAIRFGYVGQISPLKGVHTLVAAFAALAPLQGVRLLIHGDQDKLPHYHDELLATIRRYQLPIEFCGPFGRERLGDILAGIDVLVVPSEWHENNPRVIQEAFASKAPVIAADVGGITEFVHHDVNGLLFARASPAALASQIRRLLSEPALLPRLVAGIPSVKPIAAEVDEVLAIYEELIGMPQGAER